MPKRLLPVVTCLLALAAPGTAFAWGAVAYSDQGYAHTVNERSEHQARLVRFDCKGDCEIQTFSQTCVAATYDTYGYDGLFLAFDRNPQMALDVSLHNCEAQSKECTIAFYDCDRGR